MDLANPALPEETRSPRRPRPRHRWAFERLERRLLLATSPILASPDQLAQARAIPGDVTTGFAQAGSKAFFRLGPTDDELLVATLNVPGSSSRLTLLDGQGFGLAQSSGLSTTNPVDLIAQHLTAGSDYLEVEIEQAANYSLSVALTRTSKPGGSLTLDRTTFGAIAVGDYNGDGHLDIAVTQPATFQGTTLTTPGSVVLLLGTGDGTFRPPAFIEAGINPSSLVEGDFNGDGRLDLAVADGALFDDAGNNSVPGGVTILLGNGDGTFGNATSFAAGVDPTSLVTGDFNGDGHLDLAIVDGFMADQNTFPGGTTLPGGVALLIGLGDGTFESPRFHPAGYGPVSLAAGDFNGDGHLDLIVSSIGVESTLAGEVYPDAVLIPGGVAELLGNGDGSFRDGTPISTGGNPEALAVGDFNGDGHLDLAIVGDDKLDVMLGGGDGRFRARASYDVVGASLDSVVALDLNGDGRTDLAVADSGGLTVLRGQGDGTFLASNPVTKVEFGSMSEGDFNGDGRPDLVVVDVAAYSTQSNSFGASGLTVFLGDGDGTFQVAQSLPTGVAPTTAVVGDFNGDGRPDLAVANAGGVTILLGDGDGAFHDAGSFSTGTSYPVTLIARDFNGDGRVDLALADFLGPSYEYSGPSSVTIFLGNGDGTFHQAGSFVAGNGTLSSLVAGDFNGDGRVDLAVIEPPILDVYFNTIAPGGLQVLLGNGDGTFRSPRSFSAGTDPSSLTLGDFNGDGHLDLAVANAGGVTILLGDGAGAFQQGVTFTTGSGFPTSLAAGDFNGDGHLDLAAIVGGGSYSYDTGNYDQSFLLVMIGNGDGTFQPAQSFDAGYHPTSLVVGDFNGDGHLDLAAANNNTFGVAPIRSDLGITVLLGNGDGTFRPPTLLAPATLPAFLIVADVIGDGHVDLVSDTTVLLNRGDGRFVQSAILVAGIHSNPILVGSGRGDITDLAIVDQSGEILVRRAVPGQPGQFESPEIINPGSPALDITVASNGGRTLIVAADSKDNAVSLYAEEARKYARIGTLPTGLLPAQVVAVDLNGDGVDDLVVRDAGDGTTSVYLGLPGGGFAAMPAVPIGLGNSSIALADLDSSGNVGLVVTNQVAGDVRYYPGLGNGTFGLPSRYQAGAGPYAQVTAADGSTDLASDEATAQAAVFQTSSGGPLGLVTINPGTNTLAVLDRLGGGALANAQVVDTTTPAKLVRAGDFTGRGLVDIAVLGSDGVTIYLADGRGGFTRGTTYDVGPDATGLSVADLYHDGKTDLLVGDTFGDILILVGRGDGTFEPYRKTDRAIALAVADLTGGGQKDFIYADQGLDRVSVQYGGAPPSTLAGRAQGLLAPGAVSLVYFPGDPIPDLVVANSGSNNILVYPGLGNGQFGPAINGGHGYFTGTNPVGITIADLNGDGIPDLVVSNQGSNDVSTFYGAGTGASYTLQPGPRLKAGEGPAATVVETLPGHLYPDILVSDSRSNQVLQIPGVGQGFFDDQNSRAFDVGTTPGPIFVGNFTGTPGDLDLLAVDAGSNDLTLIRDFQGEGVTQTISSGGIDPVAAVAIDDNGSLDLLVANEGDGAIALFLSGLGGLALSGEMTNTDAPNPTSLALDALTGNVLEFYVGTQGREAATRLAFNLGGVEGGGATEVPPIVETPPSTSTILQVAQLQPLGEGSSLALVASLTTVTLTSAETQAESAVVEVTSSAGALPNQPIAHDDTPVSIDEEAGPAVEEEPSAALLVTPSALSPLSRFLYRLDEALERARLDAQEARFGPRSDAGAGAGAAGRAILTIDALLARWSPVPTPGDGSSPTGAAESMDASVLGSGIKEVTFPRSLSRRTGASPGEVVIQGGPKLVATTGFDPRPPVAAAITIGFVATRKLVGDDLRPRRSKRVIHPSSA